MKMNSTKLLVALFISSVFTLKAQQNQAHAGHTHEHIHISRSINMVHFLFMLDQIYHILR